jgi:hypothetical protein
MQNAKPDRLRARIQNPKSKIQNRCVGCVPNAIAHNLKLPDIIQQFHPRFQPIPPSCELTQAAMLRVAMSSYVLRGIFYLSDER